MKVSNFKTKQVSNSDSRRSSKSSVSKASKSLQNVLDFQDRRIKADFNKLSQKKLSVSTNELENDLKELNALKLKTKNSILSQSIQTRIDLIEKKIRTLQNLKAKIPDKPITYPNTKFENQNSYQSFDSKTTTETFSTKSKKSNPEVKGFDQHVQRIKDAKSKKNNI